MLSRTDAETTLAGIAAVRVAAETATSRARAVVGPLATPFTGQCTWRAQLEWQVRRLPPLAVHHRFSAYHSAAGAVGPYKNDVGPRKKTSFVVSPVVALMASSAASNGTPRTSEPSTETSWS